VARVYQKGLHRYVVLSIISFVPANLQLSQSSLLATRWQGSCDHAGQLHKFLARLTETSHGLKGRTVLYLPQGNMADPVAAAADKVLSQEVPATEALYLLSPPLCSNMCLYEIFHVNAFGLVCRI